MPENSANANSAETSRLAAIMFTDMAGCSRQMAADESRRRGLLAGYHQLVQQAVATYQGKVIKIRDNAFLVDFPSVVLAVQCAHYVQGQLRIYNIGKEAAEQIHIPIGIHVGEVVQ